MSKEHPLPTEHSPLPWGKNLEGEILDANGIYVCNYGSEHDGTLIEEACNNYHRLKECEEEVKQLREWISVEERLPEDNVKVLILSSDGESMLICYRNAKMKEYIWWDTMFSQSIENVTHWKPLPPPPSKP